ncbi:MAG: carboxymuconolactone decarboxylase family protein [Blastocatellia bacterium]
MTETNYPEYHERLKSLMKGLSRELPGPMSGFAQLHRQAMSDGALGAKYKEMIALAIGIQSQCQGCIAFHTHGALRAGAMRAEVLETIGVALMMGGGPASIYAAEAYAALDQFEKLTTK